MGSVSGATAKKRIGRFALAGTLVTLMAAAVLPATGAFASRPLPPTPHKPVVSAEIGGLATEVVGEADLNNGCGGPACRTYLAMLIKNGEHYKTLTWVDVSNLPGTQDIFIEPVYGPAKYRTAVLDYVSYPTGAVCGPVSMRIAGVKYARFSCGSGWTTYFKIFTSAPATIVGA